MPIPLQQPRLRNRKEYMANKALYKEMLPLRRNEMGRAEQAQLEIETDKSSGNLKSGAMVYWLGEDGLKSHAYSISRFGKGDFAEVISKAPSARVTQKLIDTAHAAAMTKLDAIRERAKGYYESAQ
jgi:hypothetical protein